MAHTSLAANEWLRVPPEGKPAKHPFTTDWGHNKWRIFPRRYAEWLERKGHRTSSASWVGTKRLWIWKTLAATGKKLLSCGSPRLEGTWQIGSLPWPRSTSRYTLRGRGACLLSVPYGDAVPSSVRQNLCGPPALSSRTAYTKLRQLGG